MQAVKSRGRQFIRGIGIIDETSCGPLCQHPACWRSAERLEKGLPNLVKDIGQATESVDDLPTLKVYNMLEDYGENTRDRFTTTQHQSLPSQEHKSKSHSSHLLKPLHSGSLPPTQCPANTPLSQSVVGPIRSVQFRKPPSVPAVKKVEVQEVFDLDELNNTWDDTFLGKQYYVWVPNPNRKRRKQAINIVDNMTIEKLVSGPVTVPPKDVTEELVPISIEIEREATRTKKHAYTRSHSPSRFFSATPRGHGRNDADLDGINELLDLPRDALMKVLDHCQPCDLSSRERIAEIINRFLPYREKDPNMAPLPHKSDVLQLSKVPLLDGKRRNIRQPELMGGGQPVFRLDDENLIDGIPEGNASPVPQEERALLDLGTPRQPQSLKEFSRYKKPLPAIESGLIFSDIVKIPSVSLGLPAIPSGVRMTKPFNYQKQDIDFTLGPVPTPPASEVVSLVDASEHGTTVRVNLPSDRSERVEVHAAPECTCRSQQSDTERISTSFEDSFACPNPHPGTVQSPVFYRAAPKNSGLRQDIMLTSIVDERVDILTTPIDARYSQRNTPIWVPTDMPNDRRAASAGRNEDRGHTEASISRVGGQLSMEIPPQPPSSPQNVLIPADNLSLSPTPTHVITDTQGFKEITILTPQATFHSNPASRSEKHYQINGPTPMTDHTTPASTPDVWPTDIVERSFDASRTVTRQSAVPMTPESMNSQAVGFDARSEKSRLSSVHSDASSPISELRYSRMKREENKSSESPGPPPPSPEPKKMASDDESVLKSRYSSKSRDSLSMAPVLEEAEESDDDMSISADPPQNLFEDSQKFVSTSGVAPDKNSNNAKLGPRVDTFVNVDIAGDVTASPDDDGTQLAQSEIIYQNGPPEFDGMSSTYMTERDQRFSPEGIDNDDPTLGHKRSCLSYEEHFRNVAGSPAHENEDSHRQNHIALELDGNLVDGPEIPIKSETRDSKADVTGRMESPDGDVDESLLGEDCDLDVYLGEHSDHGDVEPEFQDVDPDHGDVEPGHEDVQPEFQDVEPDHGDVEPGSQDVDLGEENVEPELKNAELVFEDDLESRGAPVSLAVGEDKQAETEDRV